MADNASRAGALNWRAEQNGGFALVTTADAISKGVASYERITDGSYIGRFDELGVYVQEPNFYEKDSTPIQVAIYDNENEKMGVLYLRYRRSYSTPVFHFHYPSNYQKISMLLTTVGVIVDPSGSYRD